MKTCPKCNILFDPGKWNKNFCSRKCANSRLFTEESNQKRSRSNSEAHKKMTQEQRSNRSKKFTTSYRANNPTEFAYCIDCNKKISKANKFKRCRSCFFKSNESAHILAHRHKNYERIWVLDSLGQQHYLIGSFEIKYYEWLSKNNIKWKKPDSIRYYDNAGKEHWYKPDFHLIDTNKIIETKGYFWNQDRVKMIWVCEQNPNLKIEILTKKELKEKGIV